MSRKAFTLIELLVVIAVIALLMAVILPSLKKAKEAAMRITCMANMRGLSLAFFLYTDDYGGKTLSSDTARRNRMIQTPWVDHSGGLTYYNLNDDPVLEEEQREAIRQGALWPYCNDAIDLFRCPTSRLGQARSYSLPDSYNDERDTKIVFELSGATQSMTIRKLSNVKNAGRRMLFIDEGWATPNSWSIFYNLQRWWDPIAERHGNGTTFSFLDGHTEHWKWKDVDTLEFARDAAEEENPNDASLWRRTDEGNEDIYRLVTAVWGHVGW